MSSPISYEARHRLVRHARGVARDYPCARKCGRPAAEWATIHGRDGANPHEDYLPLCCLCHHDYDGGSAAMGPWSTRNRRFMCYDIAMQDSVVPNVPLHIQIIGIYKRRIASGELPPGARLPTIRQMAQLHHVSAGTAARVIELLAGEQLVETRGKGGTVVAETEGRSVLGPRLVLGPQQMLSFAEPVAGQSTVVRAAGMVRLPQDGPERLVPILGLEPVPHYGWWNVYRREQVTTLPGGTPRLEVSWFDPEWAGRIPVLADQGVPVVPLGGVASLIAAESGDPVAKGWHGVEARPAFDDGREQPLFGPVVVLAAVYWWVSASGRVTEYGEYVLPQRRVIEHSYDVASG